MSIPPFENFKCKGYTKQSSLRALCTLLEWKIETEASVADWVQADSTAATAAAAEPSPHWWIALLTAHSFRRKKKLFHKFHLITSDTMKRAGERESVSRWRATEQPSTREWTRTHRECEERKSKTAINTCLQTHAANECEREGDNQLLINAHGQATNNDNKKNNKTTN